MKLERVTSRFQIEECGRAPRGFGMAWHDFATNRIVVMPVPLNIVCGLARRFWLWLAYPWRGHMTKSETACYRIGYEQGRKVQPVGRLKALTRRSD